MARIRIVACSLLILLCGCGPDMRPQFAVQLIKLSSGKAVYFKRYAWGLSSDLLVLSPDPDPCKDPDPRVDIQFLEMGLDRVFYRSTSDTITVFAHPNVSIPSGGGVLPVRLEYQDDPSWWVRAYESHAEMGIAKLDMRIARDSICK
jgi:hypothetical protein